VLLSSLKTESVASVLVTVPTVNIIMIVDNLNIIGLEKLHA